VGGEMTLSDFILIKNKLNALKSLANKSIIDFYENSAGFGKQRNMAGIIEVTARKYPRYMANEGKDVLYYLRDAYGSKTKEDAIKNLSKAIEIHSTTKDSFNGDN
jgi:hypothetical protein